MDSPHHQPSFFVVVEDNPAHAELIRRSLAEHDLTLQIKHLTDGQAALDYLYRRGEYADEPALRPDLILLDLRLPRVDGLEVLRQIKTDPNLLSIPVVILTTSNAERDVERAYASYANSYLVKQPNFKDFSEQMRDLGTYWGQRNSVAPEPR